MTRLIFTSVSLVTAMFVASLGAGSALADGDTVILQLYGQRAWEVSCQMEQDDGDRIASRERGGGAGSTGRILAQDVMLGTCEYRVGHNGMLRVTLVLDQTGLDCPFTMTDEGLCRGYFAGGTSGSFTVTATPVAADTGS
ncbi:hypothetical protein [Maricaulis sp.]|uniref:hypothetical protein n=1 Tax=Maricaulis sp. TaxID=1486257 RepID=UPI002629CEC7|nr:hypothetical protein [Maricaulis sp.]